MNAIATGPLTARGGPEDATGWSPRHLLQASVLMIGGLGFLYKFMAFAKTSIEGTLLGFAVVPLIVYLLVSSGFACLLMWSLFSGQFGHLEEAKDRMVDHELHGDDLVPLPFTDATVLPPPARLLAGSFLLASLLVLGYTFWLMFTPAAISTGAATPTRAEVSR